MSVDFVLCLCDKQEVTLYSLSPQEAVLWFLFVASCVDSAKSFSTVKLQLDTHTAGHAHTTSTCRYISALYLMTNFMYVTGVSAKSAQHKYVDSHR